MRALLESLVARARSLRRALSRRPSVEGEMDAEFRHHLALREADLMRMGLPEDEARRTARLEFGMPERYKHEGRRARGLLPFDALGISWLDVRLGGRMLVKYPGLTVVGGLAMAFAILVGVCTYEFLKQVVDPRLPLPDGARIVGVQNWDAAAGQAERRSLYDFVTWRRAVRSVESIGAFRVAQRNLLTGDGSPLPVEMAEISASAFRVTRVPALLGRTLVDADEEPGAPNVAVIGYDVWQARFGGDAGVVGRTVRLGRVPYTVVGVMPEGYGFPVAQSLWVPLRIAAADVVPGAGPTVQLFGRLAPGTTLDAARAELTTLGARAATDHPRTHARLRPQVLPYARAILNVSGFKAAAIRSINGFLVMLLVLVCGNVALLMFARAATREAEIVVRTALGASRARVVTQLFAEALVLGGLAAAVGLSGAGFALRWWLGMFAEGLERRLPFWFSARLSPETVLYALLLTVLGAVIAGVVPGLKITRGLQARLRRAAAGGGSVRFGGVWTAVIVTQVAVTLAFPVTTFIARHEVAQVASVVAEFRAPEFLAARLDMDREAAGGVLSREAPNDSSSNAFAARFGAASRDLARRLAAEPGVIGVTFADRLPRTNHPYRLVEMDAGGAAPVDPAYGAYRVTTATVARDYFDVLGAPIRTGRGFPPDDVTGNAAGVAIVNRAFVEQVLGGRNPVGRSVRYLPVEPPPGAAVGEQAPGPWLEIVGVVADLGMSNDDPRAPGIYRPLAAGTVAPVQMAVHVGGDPRAFAARLRALAAAVDPSLRLDRLLPMDELSDTQLRFTTFWLRLTMAVSGIAVMLSLTGIYAVLSFTVARRTREIGVRLALGAEPRRVIAAVFRHPLTQVGSGAAAGAVLAGALVVLTVGGGVVSLRGVAILLAYAALMLGVCLLACVVPTRRALRVPPTVALRSD